MKTTLLMTLFLLCALSIQATKSKCYGETNNGRLKDGLQLPLRGKNFEPYSSFGYYMGRTWLHSKVHAVVTSAYKTLEASRPNTIFMYGETGWQNGGRFRPHRTHQNGLSIDFMTPVLKDGKSTPLPASITNKFGYNLDFDSNGKMKEYTIDFEAIAEHLKHLNEQAKKADIKIWRVIFTPDLQPYLFKTKFSKYLKNEITFSKKKSWVRHDDHYHVDFVVDCLPLNKY